MHIYAVPLTPENLGRCLSLWAGRERYAPGEMQDVIAAAARLLAEGRALGAVVLEEGVPRAFALTTFAQEEFIKQYLAEPHAHVGKRLLLGAHAARGSDVLHLSEIADRNAGRGLQLVVANTAYDTTARDPDTVLGVLMRSFQDVHRGYRIARIVNEVFDDEAISAIVSSGSYEVVRVLDRTVHGAQIESLIGTVTREQAAASKNPLLAIFAYSPPRLFFTAPEQHLLREALAGATDHTLSRTLNIPISAVKARWSRIQERALRMAPELFNNVPLPLHGGRGVQTRHLILQFLRQHPSELTPYARPSAAVRRQLGGVRHVIARS